MFTLIKWCGCRGPVCVQINGKSVSTDNPKMGNCFFSRHLFPGERVKHRSSISAGESYLLAAGRLTALGCELIHGCGPLMLSGFWADGVGGAEESSQVGPAVSLTPHIKGCMNNRLMWQNCASDKYAVSQRRSVLRL